MPLNPITPIQVGSRRSNRLLPRPSSSARVDAPTVTQLVATCLTKATCYRLSDIGKIPRFGGIPLVRATLFRAFVISAALTGALAPVQCLGEDAQTVAGKGNEGAVVRTALAAPPKEDAETFADPSARFQGRSGTRSLEAGHHRPFPDCQDLSDLSVVG